MNYDNISLNSHLLCFDPVYKKEDGTFKLVSLGGSDERFTLENGAKQNVDGSVELSYYGPENKNVKVKYYDSAACEMKTVELVKGEDNYFRAVVNMGKGSHDVFYNVDGVELINTKAPYGYDGYSIYNSVNTFDKEEYLLNDVDHGTLSREIFFSSVSNRYRCCWVYTPASYQKSDKSYPVLYIQHGGWEDEVCWFQSGKIDMILDNLIAKGEAEEMIVVANSGYVYKEMEEGQFIDCGFDQMLTKDCIPFIDGRYRTLADRHHRAVAGLSMGASQARRSCFSHMELIANAGLFSSGEGFPTVMDDVNYTELFNDVHFNEKMDVLFVSCGDKDPRITKTTEDVHHCQQNGMDIVFKVYSGHHDWNVWRASALDYVKLLFKKG